MASTEGWQRPWTWKWIYNGANPFTGRAWQVHTQTGCLHSGANRLCYLSPSNPFTETKELSGSHTNPNSMIEYVTYNCAKSSNLRHSWWIKHIVIHELSWRNVHLPSNKCIYVHALNYPSVLLSLLAILAVRINTVSGINISQILMLTKARPFPERESICCLLQNYCYQKYWINSLLVPLDYIHAIS